MNNYLLQWFHTYVSHFGAWVTFSLGTTIWKSGVPNWHMLKQVLKVIFVVSLVGALFSSNSQVHYLTHVAAKVAEKSE